MGWQIDKFQIKRGTYVCEVPFTDYLREADCYKESPKSLIRKFASKLSDNYYLTLEGEVGKIVKSCLPKDLKAEGKKVAVFDELYMIPLNFAQSQELIVDRTSRKWCFFTLKDIPRLLKRYWDEYMRRLDARSFDRMMQVLLITYRLWAWDRVPDSGLWLQNKGNDDCRDTDSGFGDLEFWNYVIFGNLMPEEEWEEMRMYQKSRMEALGF